jgi:hypothetical protein
LYHTEDWSSLPFNERLALAVERCSGVESYNDANMSETDGPRFYQEMYDNDFTFNYLWNPKKWEEKTLAEGHDWTITETGWIPVHVNDIDNQDRHAKTGVPLTLRMAIIGAYQAYYTDKEHIKPITALQRNGGVLEPKKIMDYFVNSYNHSTTSYSGIDPYKQSEQFREQRTSLDLSSQYEEMEEQEEIEEAEEVEETEDDSPF